MQFLWIGCLESDEEFKTKATKGYELASAQVSQKNLVEGLESVSGITFDSINGAVLPPYPIYTDRIIEPVEWQHKKGAFDISVGYRNDKYINRYNCKIAMISAAKDWISKRYSGGELVIYVYSMRSGPMAAAKYIKDHIKGSNIVLIITDLPQYMDLGQSRVKAALKKIDWVFIKQMMKHMDGFVVYALKMVEFLHIEDKKWLLMEGSYDGKEMSFERCTNKKKSIMYSGKLDCQYGIPMLIDAFMGIDDSDAELWFTGGGNAEKYINECIEKDKRIHFYGFLPSRNDVLKLQQQASLLINMRLPSEPVSAYSFPSKLFEYMATGIPVISFKLEGIPKEYYKYLVMVNDESVESLRDTIENAFANISNLTIMAQKGAHFITEEKNMYCQSERIIKFLESITK